MTDLLRCIATRNDGHPCRAKAISGRPYCVGHDPAINRTDQRRAAGRHKSNASRARKRLGLEGEPLQLRQVDAALGNALAGLLAGELEPGTASAAATLARAIASVRQASDFEQRLAQLEAATGLDLEG